MNLEQLREKINQLDNQIMELINNRFLLVQQIKEIKKKQHLQVYDKKREQEIYHLLSEQSLNYEKQIKKIYQEMLKLSKELQNE